MLQLFLRDVIPWAILQKELLIAGVILTLAEGGGRKERSPPVIRTEPRQSAQFMLFLKQSQS